MIRAEAYRRGIPQTLKELDCWVLWRLENRNGRMTKVPYTVSGRRASSTDPKTWSNFDVALGVLGRQSDLYSGLGFVFSKENDIVGVDIDHCLSDGVLADEAAEIISRFPDTYCEISQSGAGLHIICRGSVPQSFRRGAVECYRDKRFFALTGDAIQPCDTTECQGGLNWMLKKYRKPPGAAAQPQGAQTVQRTAPHDGLSDSEIVEKIMQRDKRGARLLAGDWQGAGYGSPSEGDAGLATVLAFWCDRDAGQMERIFSASGLGQRRKWTSRADYRQRTIAAGCAACGESLAEWRTRKSREEAKKLEQQLSREW